MREFANVTIFESAAEIKEIGAAVHLAPNAHRIIKGLGADLAKRGCVPVRAFREWSKGAEITIDRALNPLESHGCEWVGLDLEDETVITAYQHLCPCQMLCHRVDLQNELLDLATREDGPGKPCKLSLGEQVVSCDPEFGSVTLKNGMMVTADVIIGADGIRSTVSHSKKSIRLRCRLTNCCYRFEMLFLTPSILPSRRSIAHIACSFLLQRSWQNLNSKT